MSGTNIWWLVLLFEVKSNNNDPMSQYWIKVTVVIFTKNWAFAPHRYTLYKETIPNMCLAPIYDWNFFFEVNSNNNDPMSQYWIKVTVVIFTKNLYFPPQRYTLYKETIPNMCLAPIYDYRYFLFEVNSNNNDPMSQYWIKVTVVIFYQKLGFSSTEIHII